MKRTALIVSMAAALVFIAAPVHAQRTRYGEWFVQLAGPMGEAFTNNTSDSTFGVICSAGFTNCKGYLDVNIRCEDGVTYAGLISTGSGSSALDLKCFIQRTKAESRFVFSFDSDFIVKAIQGETQVGFAFPLGKPGEFRAVRFSIEGALEAVSSLRNEMKKLPAADTNL